MKQTLLTFKSGLLTKLLLSFTLLLAGVGNLWAEKTLPYSYGFETALATEGWTVQGHASSNQYSGAKYEETYSFRFYNNPLYVTYYQHLYSPELASSTSGIDVSFYYTCNSTSYKEVFEVGYSTTTNDSTAFIWNTEVTTNDKSWHLYETSFPTGTKYIAIHCKQTSKSYNLYIDNISISATPQFKVPKDFAVSSYTANSATFSWTKGGDETTWQFDYSTNEDFTPGSGINGTSGNINDNPYTLSGLTTGTAYYAAIRADYGGGNYSDWTEKISFTPSNKREITINESGTATSYNVPIPSSYVKNNLIQSQFIIPAGSLKDIQNSQITKLKFYASVASTTWNSATFEVYLKETNNTTYSTSEKKFESWGTNVFNAGALSINSSNEMEIELNTPFNYTTGNLMVGFKQLTKSTNTPSLYWVSSSTTNTGIYYNGSSNTVVGYIPKVTITSFPITSDPVKIDDNGFTTYASPRKLDLSDLPDGLTAYEAKLIHKVSGDNMVRFTEVASQVVPANTGLLLAGTAGSTYYIPVSDESGSDLEGNLLRVNTDGGTFTPESGYTYFGMVKNSDPLTFAVFNPNSVAIPTNKAYLKVSDSVLAPGTRQLVFSFDEDKETGINSIENGKLKIEKEAIYNLAGQRVEKPVRGLYIVNGKKMVVK